LINIGDKVISIKNTETEPEGFIGYVIDNKVDSKYPIAVQRTDSNYIAAFTEDELAVLVKAVVENVKEIPQESASFDFVKARVIGVTQPVVTDIPDSEGILSYAARVSSPNNQNSYDTAAKLLKYCVEHKHYSVFETCNITMEIEVPRDIARQVLRHRSFSFQEFSQRYAESTDFIHRECRLQDLKNRQNSNKTDDETLHEYWENAQEEVLELVKWHYEKALSFGIAKEVARVLLPEGLTMSKMYMNGTVRSWLHYCELREKNGTQVEHSDLAVKCKQEIIKYFPFLSEVMN